MTDDVQSNIAGLGVGHIVTGIVRSNIAGLEVGHIATGIVRSNSWHGGRTHCDWHRSV